eukprot:COSAG01_NODE_3710_length_5770_cov_10.433962_12_plen_55_part_00
MKGGWGGSSDVPLKPAEHRSVGPQQPGRVLGEGAGTQGAEGEGRGGGKGGEGSQ